MYCTTLVYHFCAKDFENEEELCELADEEKEIEDGPSAIYDKPQ